MTYESEGLIRQLRFARQTMGLSQRDLSARTGLTQSHISQIENGALEPGLSVFIKLARALELETVAVPTRLTPALRGILKSASPSVGTMVPSGPQGAEVARFERLVRKASRVHGGSADMDQVAENLRQLRFVPMNAADLATLRNGYKLFKGGESDPPPSLLIKAIGGQLREIRNRLVHARDEREPKAAYAFDDGDDDV